MKEEIKKKFEKQCVNSFPCVDGGKAYMYKDPALYLASIISFGEGKDVFYGHIEGKRFVFTEPEFKYVLRDGLSDEEFKFLFD